MALILYEENNTISTNINTNDPYSPFATQTGFRVNHNYVRKIKLKHSICGGTLYTTYIISNFIIFFHYNLVSELYDVSIEYCAVGSSDSKFNICFKNKDSEIKSNVNGTLDTSSPNKFHLTCVVDGTLYKSNVAFVQNSVNLFNKVLLLTHIFKIVK